MAKASVLIVEDEKITALDLKEKIEEMGYDCQKWFHQEKMPLGLLLSYVPMW